MAGRQGRSASNDRWAIPEHQTGPFKNIELMVVERAVEGWLVVVYAIADEATANVNELRARPAKAIEIMLKDLSEEIRRFHISVMPRDIRSGQGLSHD
jgi:hypothetical protein